MIRRDTRLVTSRHALAKASAGSLCALYDRFVSPVNGGVPESNLIGNDARLKYLNARPGLRRHHCSATCTAVFPNRANTRQADVTASKAASVVDVLPPRRPCTEPLLRTGASGHHHRRLGSRARLVCPNWSPARPLDQRVLCASSSLEPPLNQRFRFELPTLASARASVLILKHRPRLLLPPATQRSE